MFVCIIGVGDVVTVCGHDSYSSANSNPHSHHGMTICDIRNYKEVFQLVKDLQTDIFSDTIYLVMKTGVIDVGGGKRGLMLLRAGQRGRKRDNV